MLFPTSGMLFPSLLSSSSRIQPPTHYLIDTRAELALSVLSGVLLPQMPWIILAWVAFDLFAGLSLPGLAWRAQGQSLLSAFVA